MRQVLKRDSLFILLIVVIALLCTDTLKSREDYMRTLPVYQRYKCALCHTSASPTSASDLNGFGVDFRENNYVWYTALSVQDSDSDGFVNGVELGDENGDGVADIGFERSNPGDRLNTPNSIDRGTWGILKSLFEH